MLRMLRRNTMRGHVFRWFCVAAGSILLSTPLSSQAGIEGASAGASHAQTHLGYPQDWSSRHLLMPGMRAEDVLAAGKHDPRYVYNMVMRQVAMERSRGRAQGNKKPIKIDWAA